MSLIDEANGFYITYRWYDHLKRKGNFMQSYVIMPNHVHCSLSLTENVQNINTTVGNGKRFMAYEIEDRPEAANKYNR